MLDLTGVDFFGTAGISALHTLNVRCAGEKIGWALVPSTSGHPAAADLRSRFGVADLRWRRRPRCRPCRVSRVGYCSWSRRRARDFANKRDTCICEMPTRSAICVCVNDSKNRSSSTVRSRSGNAASNGPQRFPVLDLIQTGIDVAERVGDRRRILAAAAAAVDREGVVGAARDQALDHFVTVHVQFGGELRRSGRTAEPLRQFGRRRPQPQMQFLEPAGTLTDQLLSRKCLRTSPMMVGTANDTKSEPALTLKRITALTRPTRATWTRSSRGSPRPSKRRAM